MATRTRKQAGPRSFDDVKKLATLPTIVVPLCLAGELVEEITRLERELLETKPPTSLGDASPRRVIAEQIAAVADQMRESTVEFRLRALPSREWSKLWATIPVRGEKESKEDFDERIFPFYADVVSRSCVDPEMTVDQVEELADLLHSKAWTKLANSCLGLNMGEVDVPNSDAVSELIGNSEQT